MEWSEHTCDVCHQREPVCVVKRPDGWMSVCHECRHEGEDYLGARIYPIQAWFQTVTPAFIVMRRKIEAATQTGVDT